MDMFCFQCQEAAKGVGCDTIGICGKLPSTAKLQDVMIDVVKGVAYLSRYCDEGCARDKQVDLFIMDSLFTTITNANFNDLDFIKRIEKGLKLKNDLYKQVEGKLPTDVPVSVKWMPANEKEYYQRAEEVAIPNTPDEDIRSLRELLIYGIKGMAAYAHHAYVLGFENDEVYAFMRKGMAATLDDKLSVDDYVGLVLECGQAGVNTMALLDQANTETYGDPEITKVNLGVRNNPGILVSGHDLKDFEQLLKQTEGTGVDVYTHSEMLPANYYPAFKKYDHFVGNYGNAWWKQATEFEKFNGPILMTTNCVVPPKHDYKDRLYTTGVVSVEGCKHIADPDNGGVKDFSQIIENAKKCESPEELEQGTLIGGFAHKTVENVAEKVVDAVKSGAIRKFVVMAGCDGRSNSRNYYSEFAKELPDDTVILTAGCAKYRYNKLPLGDIGGIPRVLDAGQCNDSYSLAVTALKLKEAFGLEDINDLPIVYNIAWYEQKAVIVLLALLSLGVKNIHLGPTLPAFLSPNVTNVLVENFGISPVSDTKKDLASWVG